eukprot:2032495-Prymnesium_polylepis.2
MASITVCGKGCAFQYALACVLTIRLSLRCEKASANASAVAERLLPFAAAAAAASSRALRSRNGAGTSGTASAMTTDSSSMAHSGIQPGTPSANYSRRRGGGTDAVNVSRNYK